MQNLKSDDIFSSIYKKEKGKPFLEWTQLAKSEFSSLLRKNNLENAVIAIVRMYNVSMQDVESLCGQLEMMKKQGIHLRALFICIARTDEKGEPMDGKVADTYENIKLWLQKRKYDFFIIPLYIDNYTWTAGLNAPLAVLRYAQLEHTLRLQGVSILNMSVHAYFDLPQMQRLSKSIENKEMVLTVRCDNVLLHPGKILQDALRSVTKDTKKFATSFVSLARNTAMIIPFSELISLGGFDPICNDKGGMEDVHFHTKSIIAKLLKMEKSEKKKFIAFLNTYELIIYRDRYWENVLLQIREQKLRNELSALAFISDHVRELVSTHEFVVPLARQDFYYLS